MNIVVFGLGYVGLSNAVLLSQFHHVVAVDVLPEKVERLNRRESPIADREIESFLKTRRLSLSAAVEWEQPSRSADLVIVATPTDYDAQQGHFDTSLVSQVRSVNEEALIVIRSTIPRVCGKSSDRFYLKFDGVQDSRGPSSEAADKTNIQVSVIVPVYNTESYLGNCIESILKQKNVELEIIFINDGSSDGSLDLLEQHAAKDSRIRIVSQDNSGLSASRNLGISLARGEYLLFVDSDDALAEGAIDRLYHCAKENDLEVLFFNATTVFENDDLKSSHLGLTGYYETQEDLSAVMSGLQMLSGMVAANEYRTAAYLQLTKRAYILSSGIGFIDNILHEDNAYTFELLLKASRVSKINDPLYIRTVRNGSIVTSSVQFDNLYGDLRCYMRVMALSELTACTALNEEEAVKAVSHQLAQAVIRTFLKLDPENKSRLCTLSPRERYIFELIRLSSTSGCRGRGPTFRFASKCRSMLMATVKYYRKNGLFPTLRQIVRYLRKNSTD